MPTETKDAPAGYRRTENLLEPTQEKIRGNRPKQLPHFDKYFLRDIGGGKTGDVKTEEDIANYCLKDGMALIMKGPPGCGKTAFARWFAQKHGFGFYRVGCSEDTTTRDFFGSLAPSSEGEFRIIPGPVLQGVIDGNAVILIDDFNLADKNVVAALYPLLDSREFPNPFTSERYTLPKEVMIMLAMNPGGMYALESSPALKRRPLAVRFDYLPKPRAVEMALSKLDPKLAADPGVRPIAEGIWDGVDDVRRVYRNSGLTKDGKNITMCEEPGDGTIIDTLKMRCSGFSIEVAARVAVAERIISDTATNAKNQIDAIVQLVSARVGKHP